MPRPRNPYTRCISVTPNDTTDLSIVAEALYVTGAGNIVIVTSGGDEVTLTVPANFTLENLEVTRVKATGTTATGIFAIR